MEPKPGKTPERAPHDNYSAVMDALDKNLPDRFMYRMGKDDGVVDERVFMLAGTPGYSCYFLTKDGPYIFDFPDLDESSREDMRHATLKGIARNRNIVKPNSVTGKYLSRRGDDHEKIGVIQVSIPTNPNSQELFMFSTTPPSNADDSVDKIYPASLSDFQHALFRTLSDNAMGF